MKIVTGYQGKAHITSNDDQGRNQGIFGTDSYVTSVGQQFAATLVNANELDIADGEGVMQGVHFRIEPGEVDAAKLQNGTSGMKRIDLVVARYTKDSSTGIENVALVVIKGTESSSTPAVPAYNSGEILKGKNTVDFPLYKVTYNGINVSSVDRMFTKLQTMAELQTAVNKLNTDLNGIGIIYKNYGQRLVVKGQNTFELPANVPYANICSVIVELGWYMLPSPALNPTNGEIDNSYAISVTLVPEGLILTANSDWGSRDLYAVFFVKH